MAGARTVRQATILPSASIARRQICAGTPVERSGRRAHDHAIAAEPQARQSWYAA